MTWSAHTLNAFSEKNSILSGVWARWLPITCPEYAFRLNSITAFRRVTVLPNTHREPIYQDVDFMTKQPFSTFIYDRIIGVNTSALVLGRLIRRIRPIIVVAM